jgi:hypothetical protein
MSAGGNQAESSRLETGCKSVNVVDSELDLDFPVISHVRQYKRMRSQQTYIAIRLQRALPALKSELFYIFAKKKFIFIKLFKINRLREKSKVVSKQRLSGHWHLTLGQRLR